MTPELEEAIRFLTSDGMGEQAQKHWTQTLINIERDAYRRGQEDRDKVIIEMIQSCAVTILDAPLDEEKQAYIDGSKTTCDELIVAIGQLEIKDLPSEASSEGGETE